jgi:hypothetical protein
MFRIILATLVAASFAVTSVQAAISVDGSVSDWLSAGLLRTDPSNDKASTAAAVEVLRFGATVEDNTFYAVMEMSRPVSAFDGSYPMALYPVAFINVDQSTATTLPNASAPGGVIRFPGTDIMVEWDRYDVGPGGSETSDPVIPGVYFWGKDGSRKKVIATPPAGAGWHDSDSAALGVVEWSCPVSEITAALPLTNGAKSGPVWSITLSMQGYTGNTSDPLGYDFGRDQGDLLGDANYDGTTNVADLTNLLNNYNKTGMTWANGDFDRDGVVNVADLTALLNNYNKTTDVVVSAGASLQLAVPEPSSIVLLTTLSALIGAWVIRRRSR